MLGLAFNHCCLQITSSAFSLGLQSRADHFELIAMRNLETVHSKPIPSDVVKNPDNGLASWLGSMSASYAPSWLVSVRV